MTDLPAALLLERPCRPCQDGDHGRCMGPLDLGQIWPLGCCCDDLDRDPDPPRWHP